MILKNGCELLLVVVCGGDRRSAGQRRSAGHLQVANKFHDWLQQNERDMASLAWELAAIRERRGFGSIKVLYQLGHPEKRKAQGGG